MKTLVVCSGGLDSVTLAYQTAAKNQLSALVAFDYGQRHKRELIQAEQCAKALNVPFELIDISAMGALLSGSALTDDIAVPDGHYAEESMRLTVVPNRNTIMLSIAFGVAAARGYDAVAVAVHGGDHFIYPDCRPDFIDSFQTMQNHALEGVQAVQLEAPFVHMDKSAIVKIGAELKVPFAQTWSCYRGEQVHCGRCGTCVERQEAFALAAVDDPTPYKDAEFWLKALEQHTTVARV